jgi:hypothetical protein
MALAAALAFTTIVTFALLLTGTRGGLFRSRGNAEDEAVAATEPSPEEIAGALQYLASAAVPPAQEPEYTTEYVYVDGPSGPPTVRYVTAASPPSAPTGGQPSPGAPPTAPAGPPPAATAEPTEPWPEPTQPAPPPPPTEVPPPAPTSPPEQRGPLDEDEFTGTVTAINGDVVTFAHDGTTTDVRVTDDLDRLDVGTRAKVHALLLSSGWVAKEIEVDDD